MLFNNDRAALRTKALPQCNEECHALLTESRLERQKPEFNGAVTVARVPRQRPELVVNHSDASAHDDVGLENECHDLKGSRLDLFIRHLKECDAGAVEAPRAFRAERLSCLYA